MTVKVCPIKDIECNNPDCKKVPCALSSPLTGDMPEILTAIPYGDVYMATPSGEGPELPENMQYVRKDLVRELVAALRAPAGVSGMVSGPSLDDWSERVEEALKRIEEVVK